MRRQTGNARRFRRVLRGSGCWLTLDELKAKTGVAQAAARRTIDYLMRTGDVVSSGNPVCRSYRWAASPEPEQPPLQSITTQIEEQLRSHPEGLTVSQLQELLPHLTAPQLYGAIHHLMSYERAVQRPPNTRGAPWHTAEPAEK